MSEDLQVKGMMLMLQHACGELNNSWYVVPVPPMGSDCNNSVNFELDGLEPVLSLAEEKNPLIDGAEMVVVGDKVYFLGGKGCPYEPLELTRAVYALDVKKPEEGLRAVAPMNDYKDIPCVFEADGMVYAIGSTVASVRKELVPGSGGSGLFERYDPRSDTWEVLPDPPLPFSAWPQQVTMVGRDVYFGNISRRPCVIYNLDSNKWRTELNTPFRSAFPCGSVYVDGYLYYLRGGGLYSNPLPVYVDPEGYAGSDKLQLVAKKFNPNGPPGPARVIAKEHDLDGGFFFAGSGFVPWRGLFHLGGSFFCYVVSSELVDAETRTVLDQNTRGIGISVFQVVEAQFRPVASVCYTAPTIHKDFGYHVRFATLTTLPNCITLARFKDKLFRVTPKEKMDKDKAVDRHLKVPMPLEFTSNVVVQGEANNVEMILKAQQAQISCLMAELARKDELLGVRLKVKKGLKVDGSNSTLMEPQKEIQVLPGAVAAFGMTRKVL